MKGKFSIYSSIFVVVGLFFAYLYFPPVDFFILELWGIPIGFIIYIIGLIFGGVAFYKKERGFLKYISVISLLLAIALVGYLYYIIASL